MMVENILADLISLRTDDRQHNKQCVDYICEVLLRHEVLFERLYNPDGRRENIVAGINVTRLQDINTGLVLSGHIDTVGANSKYWDTDPFEAVCLDGHIYGRGTVDMKYFIAVVLSLLPELKQLKIPVFLLFSGDEETDVCGIRVLTSFLEDHNIVPKFALVGEPTHFDVCVANKGYVGYTTTIKGVAGHSSCPGLGCNAAYVAAKIISEIEKLNEQYEPSGTTLNVGVLKGGEGRNSIPSEMFLDWEIRYFEEEHKIRILQQMSDLQKQLMTIYPQARIMVTETENLPLFQQQKKSKIVDLAQSILKSKTMIMPHATEAGFLQKMGTDTVICGAGDERLAHTSSENIEIRALHKYREFLLAFVQKLDAEEAL